VINIRLQPRLQTLTEVTIHAPDEEPSITLLKHIIKNKPVNNKKKLSAYQFQSYNKIQFSLNNLGEKFKESKIVKNLSLVMNYLDTVDGKTHLPLILTET